MDDKNQNPGQNKQPNLTPELKEIYERVMNTNTQQPTPPAPPQNQPTTSASNQQPQNPSVGTVDQPASVPPTHNPAQPAASPSQNQPQKPAAPSGTNPPSPTIKPPGTPQNSPFLSSLPPRPISGSGQSFSFSAKNGQPASHAIPEPTPNQPQNSTNPTTDKPPKKKLLSGKILAVLVIALLIGWGVLWAKVFGLF